VSDSPAIVTGAGGWLGRRLVYFLRHGMADVPSLACRSGRQIRCLVYPGENHDRLDALADDVAIIEGDVTRPGTLDELFARASGATVFHCAGLIHPRWRVRDLFRVNAGGTRHIVRAAERAGARRLIYVSSNSPVGCNRGRDERFDESSPYDPYMSYGESKRQAEILVNEAAARGHIETVIIRPPWFYGVAQPARQTEFFRMIRDGRAPILGDGEARRSMAYVDNICQGLLLAERTACARNQTYWIADARPSSINEIVDTIERLLETEFGQVCRYRRLRLPNAVSELAFWVDWSLQRLGVYSQKIHVLSEMNKTIACTIDKARAELGFEPVIALEEGMRRSLQWVFDEHGGLEACLAAEGAT